MNGKEAPHHVAALASPIGRLVVFGTAKAVTHVTWSDDPIEISPPDDSPVAEAARQLDAYFQRRLQKFDVPMAPCGSPFQGRVWSALSEIPFGEVVSYGDIASLIDSAARPVGVACGANPIPILIPCHRVIAANGRLTGYSGGEGVKTKQILLSLENRGQADLVGITGTCYDATPKERRHHA